MHQSNKFENFKSLWEEYKNSNSNKIEKYEKEFKKLQNNWEKYREKIENGSLVLDEYTNVLGNDSAKMPGGYLCNFLERTTKNIFGSSKPGDARHFEVKLNNNKKTYYVKDNKDEANRESANDYFENFLRPLLKNIVTENNLAKKIENIYKSSYSAKQILMKMAVLDNPGELIYIYAKDELEELHSYFCEKETNEKEVFEKNIDICKEAKRILDIADEDKGNLVLLSKFLWEFIKSKAISDEKNPNVILYGPPGTGKTYSVKKSLDLVCKGDISRYEFVQFHPSFTYEDFIEGIKPKGVSKDGNIRFEVVNGIFKNFCIKAKKDLEKKDYYFVVDEINRANLSAVFGETLSLIEKDYRDTGDGKNLIKTQYSALIEDLIREDKANYEHLAYEKDDNGEVKFGIPENVHFIGMMNDVDKSIDAFDLALRRRFKWIRKDCDYEVIKDETLFKGEEVFANIEAYVNACKILNSYITDDLGLGKSYAFGHSFFMKMSDIAKAKKISQKNLNDLFINYLKPTLTEYVRTVFSEDEVEGKLDEALAKFKIAEKD